MQRTVSVNHRCSPTQSRTSLTALTLTAPCISAKPKPTRRFGSEAGCDVQSEASKKNATFSKTWNHHGDKQLRTSLWVSCPKS